MRFPLLALATLTAVILVGCGSSKKPDDKLGLRPDQYSNRTKGQNVVIAPDGSKTSVLDGADPKELGFDPYPGSTLESGALYVKETPRETTTLGTFKSKADAKLVVAHYEAQLKAGAKKAGGNGWIIVGQLQDGRVVTITVIAEDSGETTVQAQSAKPAVD